MIIREIKLKLRLFVIFLSLCLSVLWPCNVLFLLLICIEAKHFRTIGWNWEPKITNCLSVFNQIHIQKKSANFWLKSFHFFWTVVKVVFFACSNWNQNLEKTLLYYVLHISTFIHFDVDSLKGCSEGPTSVHHFIQNKKLHNFLR